MPDKNLIDYIDEKISRGEFSSREEFMTEAVRIYRTLETDYDLLKTQILERLTRSRNGDLRDLEIDRLKDRLDENLDR